MLNQQNKDVLLNSQIGFEFEFYSNTSVEETAKSVGQLLGRKIKIEEKAHSDFQPSDKVFKMEPDMSGGAGLIELVTGPLPYTDARLIAIKMLRWIDENGSTNDRCGLHLNISFQNGTYGKYFITHMNTLKFVLEFKEDQVYKYFPQREDLVYAKSIKYILPKNGLFHFDERSVNKSQFNYPNTKYYGVNFLKQEKGYLEFRYLGGKDYQKRASDILHLMDDWIIQLHKVCSEPGLSELNRLELRRIMRNMGPIISLYRDHRNFNKFQDITFTFDLSEDGGNRGETIDMYWDQIKDRVIKLIAEGGMVKGHINYDSDRSKVQIQNAEFKGAHDLEQYEFVNCKVAGAVMYSDFYNCNLTGSDIEGCNLYQSTKATDCKIKSSYVHQSCVLKDSYLFGRDGVFKGKMIGGIFREGNYSESTAEFDGTEIIQSKKIK